MPVVRVRGQAPTLLLRRPACCTLPGSWFRGFGDGGVSQPSDTCTRQRYYYRSIKDPKRGSGRIVLAIFHILDFLSARYRSEPTRPRVSIDASSSRARTFEDADRIYTLQLARFRARGRWNRTFLGVSNIKSTRTCKLQLEDRFSEQAISDLLIDF